MEIDPTFEALKERLKFELVDLLTIESVNDQTSVQEAAGHIIGVYTAKDRHYHGLWHINDMLEIVGSERDSIHLRDRRAVKLAIWFHDLAYDPTIYDLDTRPGDPGTNEDVSAIKASQILSALGFDQQIITKVERMVREDYDLIPIDDRPDARVFFDADRAILASYSPDYWQYAKGVRREFTTYYDIETYTKGRIIFLQKMIVKAQDGTLFRSQLFGRRFSKDDAIKNMRQEILRLEQSPNDPFFEN